MVRHIVDDEDLNLQDLIFILIFFFIIAQTLIVFQKHEDLLIPPKVDDKINKSPKDKDIDLNTVIIDHKSNIYTLIKNHGRDSVLKGFDSLSEDEIPIYMDPMEGKDKWLPSEKSTAHNDIVDKITNLKMEVGFEKPQLGLIADHRARYGTIFQINMAVTELISAEQVRPEVKWKVLEEGKSAPTEAEK